jgi:hypothetical protein
MELTNDIEKILYNCCIEHVDPSFTERMAYFYSEKHLYNKTEEDEPDQISSLSEPEIITNDDPVYKKLVKITNYKSQNLKTIDLIKTKPQLVHKSDLNNAAQAQQS